MNPQSQRLSEMFSARLSDTAHDEVAGIVLGPRLCSLCVALGAPVRDWWQICRWATRLGDAHVRDALGAYLDVLVAARCRVPGDDLISELIAHDVDGDGLTAEEIRTVLVDFVRACSQPV
ncbi:hypothetical protein [Mycolicibacterium austroafricanum]|uniref:hypothetical protein n=1 Tax=Mycolicibacterium austroafricanum TaxID=39687 RepID=UPI001F40D7B2|nr:hypothetical protein [Mycolicibacterium austroafricanum]